MSQGFGEKMLQNLPVRTAQRASHYFPSWSIVLYCSRVTEVNNAMLKMQRE